MDYSQLSEVFNSLATQIPSLYRLFLIGCGITGVCLTISGVTEIIASNRANQKPRGAAFCKMFFGPLLFVLGGLLEMGSYTLFREFTNPILMDSYTTQTGDDLSTFLYPVRFYIGFIGFVLMGRAVYVAAVGADTKRENWQFESLGLWLLAVCCYAFDSTVNMISSSAGQGLLGTEYFSF